MFLLLAFFFLNFAAAADIPLAIARISSPVVVNQALLDHATKCVRTRDQLEVRPEFREAGGEAPVVEGGELGVPQEILAQRQQSPRRRAKRSPLIRLRDLLNQQLVR